jgi:glycosyltransferase involved in cell wall biosynthesis
LSGALWIFDDAPIMGGAELFALRLARWLAECDEERDVRLVCPPGSELAERCRAHGVTIEPLTFHKPRPGSAALRTSATFRSVRRLLAGAGKDTIALGNTALAQAYLAFTHPLVRPGPPLVHLLHERHTAARLSARLVLPRSGALLAIGERHAEAYRKALGAGVASINVFLTPDELRAAVERRAPPPGGPAPVLGLLGRLTPEKGVLELLDELAAEPDAWRTLRIGAPPQDPEYSALVERRVAQHGLEDRVELLGYVNDLAGFFASIDVLVAPSTGPEGQMLSILDALAHGRPCVVREPALADEHEGLPVTSFVDGPTLAARLRETHAVPPVDPRELAARFGPEQALQGIEEAASRTLGIRNPVR